MASIDEALKELIDALHTRGIEAPVPPADLHELEAASAKVAPFRLPSQLEEFWRRIDPKSVRVLDWPTLSALPFALREWPDDIGGGQLLQIGYESHQWLFVELDGPGDHVGGSVFVMKVGDDDFFLAYDDLADYVRELARKARDPELAIDLDNGYVSAAQVSDPHSHELAERRLARNGPHPVYGSTMSFPYMDGAPGWTFKPYI